MSELQYYAQAIKEAVPIMEVIQRYLPGAVYNKHYIQCPFHTEKTPSLRIYENAFYCFGCAAHGDVIGFVSQLHDVPPYEAMKRLNDDFGLSLPIGRKKTLRELMEQKKRDHINDLVRKETLALFEEADADYSNALDEWLRLEINRHTYEPQSQNEDFHPLFIEALIKGDQAKYELDQAGQRRDELECRVRRHMNSSPQPYTAWTPHSS